MNSSNRSECHRFTPLLFISARAIITFSLSSDIHSLISDANHEHSFPGIPYGPL